MLRGPIRILWIAALATAGTDVAAPQTILWWTTHDLAKIKPLDPVPADPPKAAELRAGRNEFEPFQLVLRSTSLDLSGIDIDFSDFHSAEGGTISSRNINVYLE